MIVTRDGAEGFALRAFAAARGAKKEKGLVFHARPAYTANGTAPASTVIPTEIQATSWSYRSPLQRNLRLRCAPLKMTTSSPRRDLRSPVALGDRNARSRQPEQRSCNRDQARRFFP